MVPRQWPADGRGGGEPARRTCRLPAAPGRRGLTLRLSHTAPLILAGLALAFGLWGRAWHLFAEPLWLDEAYSAYAADRGLAFLWRVVPAYETHPPFYYTLLHGWGLIAGDTLAARRLPGLLCGLAAVAATGLAAARMTTGRRTRFVVVAALALAALSPVLIEMSRQVRPYPVMILVYALGVALLLRPGPAREKRTLPLLGIAQALLAWLHTLGPFFAAALLAAWLVLHPPRDRAAWLRLALAELAVGVAYLPALLIALDQAPTWVASTWLRFDWTMVPVKLAVLFAAPDPWAAGAAALLASAGAATMWRDGRRRQLVALLLLALLPVALSVALSALVTPVFIVRTLSPAAVPAILLIACGAAAGAGRWRWVSVVLLLALLGALAAQDIAWRARGPMQDWYGTVRWVAARHRPGDAIWAYPNEGALPFDLAARDLGLPLRARPIPGPVPVLAGIHPTGSRGVVTLDPAGVARMAADPQARRAPVLWLLRMGPATYDPDDRLLDRLGRARRIVTRRLSGPVDIVGLARR